MPKKKSKWPSLPWDKVVDRVSPIVFRVYAPSSLGTAFVISIGRTESPDDHAAIFATARHVVDADIGSGKKIELVSVNRERKFSSDDDEIRVQHLGEEPHDTVLLMVRSRHPILSQSELLPMMEWDKQLARGSQLGWLGFPGIFEPELCFFSGHVSGYRNDRPTYLVDGVAIGGVSGGPAFDDRAHIIGMVSSYVPNQIDPKTTLPGVLTLVPINAIRLFMEANMRATVL